MLPSCGYDVAPDGRFLINEPVEEGQAERASLIFPSTLRVMLNWTSGIEGMLAAR